MALIVFKKISAIAACPGSFWKLHPNKKPPPKHLPHATKQSHNTQPRNLGQKKCHCEPHPVKKLTQIIHPMRRSNLTKTQPNSERHLKGNMRP
jgi:hypothetical protein